jgi:16S rRNA (cytosine1402-N4)-methyltransferase
MTASLAQPAALRTETRHETVLLTEAVEGLAVRKDDVVVDATLGGAGHFSALLSKLGPDGAIVGIDADHEAVERARARAEGAEAAVHLVEGNFRDLAGILDDLSLETADRILFDLGWSAFHLTRGRGFSFRADEPLLMTYGEPAAGKTAADLVNGLPESELADLIYEYGEERFARQIARGIADARKRSRILTTGELVAVIEKSTPAWYAHRRIHPATKTFQALRIAANDELGSLREGLTAAMERLSDGGRIAVISFHSIEDRIVKSLFRDAVHAGQGTLVMRKPLAPSAEECARNPRARSAKLRIYEKGVQPA